MERAGCQGVRREGARARCTLHKRRNVTGYLPVARRKAIDKRLAGIFANADAEAGLRDARRLAAQLKKDHPDAAGSPLEGLEECSPLPASVVNGALRRSLTNTNCIESMISAVRVVTGRVKHWHDGDMKKRWIATGMIEAQRSFRRVRGHTHMATLAALITDTINPVAPDNYAQAVA
ncbi:MAG: transposase [Mycetocola sp.]